MAYMDHAEELSAYQLSLPMLLYHLVLVVLQTSKRVDGINGHAFVLVRHVNILQG